MRGKGVEGEVPGSGDEPSARGWIGGGDGGGGAAMLDACYYGAEQRLEQSWREERSKGGRRLTWKTRPAPSILRTFLNNVS